MSTRREFIRHSALATAAAAAGLPLTGTGSNVVTEGDRTTLKWDKAPCRYCGTGCGVNVAVKGGAWWPRTATCMPRSTAASTA